MIKTYTLAIRNGSDDTYQKVDGIPIMTYDKAQDALDLVKLSKPDLDVIIYNPFCE